MINYCPKCGAKKEEDDQFCTNCGINLNENIETKTFEKQIAYASKETGATEKVIYTPPAQYTQPQNYTIKKQSHKKRTIISITTVAIAVMVVLASFIILLNSEPEDSDNPREITKLVKEHGPKISLHSLSGGSVSSIPEEGYTAKYGLYDESGIFGTPHLRIGEITEENLGEKTFQGEECILVKINGQISIPMKRYMESYLEVSSYLSTDSTSNEMLNMIPEEVPFYIYSDYYITKDDGTPVYMDYTIDLTEYMQIIQDISTNLGYGDDLSSIYGDEDVIMGYIIDWDREESKADMSFYMEGIPLMSMAGDFTIEFSEEYWDIEPEMEELYVGFQKIVEFTMNLEVDDFYYNTDYTSEEESEYYSDGDYGYSLEDEISQTVSTSMEIEVIAKENVNIPAGTFNDCFVIEVTQRQNTEYEEDDYGYGISSSSSSSTTSTKIWIDENGVLLKAEYSLFGDDSMNMGSSSQGLVIELEDYTK